MFYPLLLFIQFFLLAYILPNVLKNLRFGIIKQIYKYPKQIKEQIINQNNNNERTTTDNDRVY